MKYFSMFSGIGGFELGINNAWRNTNTGKEESEEYSKRNKSVLEGLEEKQYNKSNNKSFRDTQDTNRTLFQGGQEQGNSFSRDMDETKTDVEVSINIRPIGDNIRTTRTNLSDDKKIIFNLGDCSELNRRKQPVCVGYSEIDKYAIQIYKKHFGGHENYGDANKIRTYEIPDFDLLVGGTPCQDFSIAGKRKGLFEEDGSFTRSGLFYHFIRVAKRKKPKYILMENVKGMLSSKNKDREFSFDNMMEAICDIGYIIDFTILNSKYFGVPQNRERVFILAIREDLIEKRKTI